MRRETGDQLYHYGVKGMKWGHRKKQPTESRRFKTAKGEELVFERENRTLLAKGLGKVSKKLRDEQERSHLYKVKDANGKKVGNYQAYNKTPDEFNVVWMDVSKKHRGKGYATAIMKQGEALAKEYGSKKITAEVIGKSPDMLHVSEKLGYVKVGEDKTKEAMEVWGGLTYIEKDITKSR